MVLAADSTASLRISLRWWWSQPRMPLGVASWVRADCAVVVAPAGADPLTAKARVPPSRARPARPEAMILVFMGTP